MVFGAVAVEVLAAFLGGVVASAVSGAVGVYAATRRMQRVIYDDAAVAHEGGLIGAVRDLKRRVRRIEWTIGEDPGPTGRWEEDDER